MIFLDVVLSLFAIIVFSVLISHIFKINTAFAPITAIGVTMIYFSILGCFDLLVLAGYVYYLLVVLALIYVIYIATKKDFKYGFFTPAFIVFVVTSFAVLCLFAMREPIFSEWDEFSLWGIASKIMFSENRLYPIIDPNPMVGISQKPALIVYGWFMQFFGSEFSEWKVLFAYNTVIFATWSCIIGKLDFKKWKLVVPMTVLSFLMPFFFTAYFKQVYTMNIYMSAYADIPMGMLMGGILAMWYWDRENSIIPIIISIISLTLFKDTGMIFAAVIMTMIACDMVIFSKKFAWYKKGITIISGYLAIGLPYILWNKYLAYAFKIVDRYQDGGTELITVDQMLIKGTLQLFAKEKDPEFVDIMGKMVNALYSSDWKISMIGQGVFVIAFICLIVIATMILSKDKQHVKRTALYGVLMIPAFVVYYLFIGFTYVYIFKDNIGANLDSYNRYIYPFYLGWLIGALVLMAIGSKNSRYNLLNGGILFISVVLLLRFSQLVSPQLCVIDYSDAIVTKRNNIKTQTELIMPYFEKGDNIYFISQNDNGEKWFYYTYEVLPYQMDYSEGGGILAAPGALEEGTDYYHPYTKDEWAEYLSENGCDYVFIENTGVMFDLFISEYADLFTDDLQGAINGETSLYKVENNGEITLSPVDMKGVGYAN